ncbi:MAG: colanic acid biosynthesis glycosyltransferase WcaI, partial [Verrucomicrobia bacterium]|nr:colanic acid biosynthesis glycosyltransferase WcaI [Verrucomicrobiota bacterium]
PVIFLGPEASEVAQVIRQTNCGAVLPDADGAALAREIERWLADVPGREAAGRRGRAAVESEDVRAVAERFAAALAGHRG